MTMPVCWIIILVEIYVNTIYGLNDNNVSYTIATLNIKQHYLSCTLYSPFPLELTD